MQNHVITLKLGDFILGTKNVIW